LSNCETQVWKSCNFSIAALAGDEPGTVIYRLDGPFTARDMYSSLSPDEVRQIFETLPANKQPSVQIFDVSGVPYMDSVGLGMLVRLYVSSRNKGIRMSISGCTPPRPRASQAHENGLRSAHCQVIRPGCRGERSGFSSSPYFRYSVKIRAWTSSS
jgi:hypothetical protein